nr:MAG TPA: minor capsid protein [Caudoviricetes sp.]
MKTTKMNKTVDAFEIEIKRLLKKGLSVKDAVNEAYKKYPVMSEIKKEIEPQIISEMKRGSSGNISLKTIKLASQLVWSEDELTLSERTIKGEKEVIKQVSNTIKNAIKKGESVQKTALALFDGYGYGNILPTQEIPEFLKDLVNTAKKTDLTHKEINALIRQVERQLKKVNVTGMKIAYNKVKEAVKTGCDRVVEKAIYIATQERTRYFARRIARTELARAYVDGVMGQWANDEDCIAFKWQTSSAHPHKDICDLYANADLYGMGKGVYPKDKVPILPVHPNCMCHIRPLMQGSKYIQGEEKEQIQKGGMEYINGLNKHEQERLLGVYGRLEVLKKGNWTGKARNYSKEYMKSRISEVNNGAIYGALNDKNDPTQERREAHAERYYEFIINIGEKSFVDKISKNSGFSKRFLSEVFNHVFIDKHHLCDGYRKFDASYYMSESFQRLLAGNYNDNDIVLLRHEHLERALEKRYNLTYKEAHKLAESKYFYKRKG